MDPVQNNNDIAEIPSDIRQYLEELLADAGMITVDDIMREEMIKELYVRLERFLAAALVENLPDDKTEEFISMNEQKKSKPEIEEFLKQNMPDASNVFAQAFATFRQLYLDNIAVSRNSPQDTPQKSS